MSGEKKRSIQDEENGHGSKRIKVGDEEDKTLYQIVYSALEMIGNLEQKKRKLKPSIYLFGVDWERLERGKVPIEYIKAIKAKGYANALLQVSKKSEDHITRFLYLFNEENQDEIMDVINSAKVHPLTMEQAEAIVEFIIRNISRSDDGIRQVELVL